MNTNNIIRHYDALIDIDNDPVKDQKPLKDYMDKWDGQEFIDKLKLDKDKTVLEIGVGTGRLAVKTAPKVKELFGIDVSYKTLLRAIENLKDNKNINVICGDFLKYKFSTKFDVIYSSLTFMHVKSKRRAIKKAYKLLNDKGRFVLSADKSQDRFIDAGVSKIKVYPNDINKIKKYFIRAGFSLEQVYQTDFAHIIIANKTYKENIK